MLVLPVVVWSAHWLQSLARWPLARPAVDVAHEVVARGK